MTTTTNAVKAAVYKVGGPTQVGILLRVNSQTVHQWIRKGYVPNFALAKKLAKVSGSELESLRPAYPGVRLPVWG